MNYEKLREIQLFERNNPELYTLEEDFYERAKEYLEGLRRKIKENISLESLRDYENSIKVLREIYVKREQKLVLKALTAARTGMRELNGLAKEEKEMFQAIVELLRRGREQFERMIEGKEKEIKSSSDRIWVRILTSVPRFMSPSREVLGPFEPDEIVELPRREAELLIRKNIAEPVERW